MTTALAHAPGTAPAPTPPPSGSRRERRSALPYLLLLPGLLWLVVFFVIPMLFLASQSLQEGSVDTGYVLTWHWQTYTDAFALYAPQLIRSLVYAAVATVGAFLIGYPLAYAIAFKSGRWKNFLLVMVIAPFFTSFLIRTLAWETILSSDGPVVAFLRWTHIIDLLQAANLVEGRVVLGTPLSVVTGLTYNFLPFMILPLYASLERLDQRLLEAAGDLYARPFMAFRKVTLPLSMPGVVAGTLLTFIPAAGDYINSKLLGSPSTAMIGQVIDGQFLRVLDYPTAAALSFTLMAIILVVISLYIWRAGTEELV